jgi:hypothetical protein
LKLTPSSGFPAGIGTPARSAIVGRRSMAPAIGRIVVPGAILPVHRISSGDRTPPSSVDPLRPFMPPFHRQLLGPLSWK